MGLEERLKELLDAEDQLNDAELKLRTALLKYTAKDSAQREKLISEALFKIRAGNTTVRHLRIRLEQKQKRKKVGLTR